MKKHFCLLLLLFQWALLMPMLKKIRRLMVEMASPETMDSADAALDSAAATTDSAVTEAEAPVEET